MLIGEVSKKVGVAASTIRYYEKISLIPKVRNNSGYREYPSEIIELLGLIVKAKELGFSLNEIKEFSFLLQELGQDSGRIRSRLEDKIIDLEEKIKELRKFKNNVKALLNAKCPL